MPRSMVDHYHQKAGRAAADPAAAAAAVTAAVSTPMTAVQEVAAKCLGHNTSVLSEVLQFLDVAILVEKKQVNKMWKEWCTKAIDNKCKTPRPFQDYMELRAAVKKYCQNDPVEMEQLSHIYGYPIGKWDVSQMTSLSTIFIAQGHFNEDISAWDTSNVKDMSWMFCKATVFNQDISSWDTSKVKNMSFMFCIATSFNQDISHWDTANVEYMSNMFYDAKSFNQDISSWDTSQVKRMTGMFQGATCFNQDLSTWDISSLHVDDRQCELLGRFTAFKVI